MNKKYTYIIFIALIFLSLTVSGCLNNTLNEPKDQIPNDNINNNNNNNEQKTGLKNNDTNTKENFSNIIVENISIDQEIFRGEYYNVSVFVRNNGTKKSNYTVKIKNKTEKVIKNKEMNFSNYKTRRIDFKLFADEIGEKKIISGNHSQSYKILEPEKNLECKFIIEQDSYITSNYFQLNISGINGEYEAFIKNPNNKILDQKQINTEEFQKGNKNFTITLAKNQKITNPGEYKAYVVDDTGETILNTPTKIKPAKPEIIDIEISKTYEESSKGKISDIRIKLMNYGDISTKLNEGVIETIDKKRSLNFQTEKILKPQETSIIKDNIYISDIELGNYDLNIRLFYHTELISQKKITYQITKND